MTLHEQYSLLSNCKADVNLYLVPWQLTPEEQTGSSKQHGAESK